jgi:hypothetical protein
MAKSKIKILFSIMLLLIVGLSGVYAEDNTTSVTATASVNTSSVDTGLLLVFNDPLGAQLKIEELKTKLQAQIDAANTLIEELAANNVSVDYDKLANIVAGYEALIPVLDNVSYDNLSDAYSTFIYVKDTAYNLSQEFKTTVDGKLDAQLKLELKNQYREKLNQSYQERAGMVQELKKQYKVQALKKELVNFNGVVNVSEIVNQYQNGKLNLNQVKNMLQKRLETDPNATKVMEKVQVKIQMRNKEVSQQAKEVHEVMRKKSQEMNKIMNKFKEEKFNEIANRVKSIISKHGMKFNMSSSGYMNVNMNMSGKDMAKNMKVMHNISKKYQEEVRNFIRDHPDYAKVLNKYINGSNVSQKDIQNLNKLMNQFRNQIKVKENNSHHVEVEVTNGVTANVSNVSVGASATVNTSISMG